jgi:hypothetical protein
MKSCVLLAVIVRSFTLFLLCAYRLLSFTKAPHFTCLSAISPFHMHALTQELYSMYLLLPIQTRTLERLSAVYDVMWDIPQPSNEQAYAAWYENSIMHVLLWCVAGPRAPSTNINMFGFRYVLPAYLMSVVNKPTHHDFAYSEPERFYIWHQRATPRVFQETAS